MTQGNCFVLVKNISRFLKYILQRGRDLVGGDKNSPFSILFMFYTYIETLFFLFELF